MELQIEKHTIAHRELSNQHKKEWENRKQELIKAAKFACDNGAFSYRNFLVGTALLGWSEKEQKYIIALAGNLKEREKKDVGEDKRCSERGAIDYLLAKAPDAKIVGMVVASKETGTDPNPANHTKTLHCCEECRTMLSQKNCVDKNAPILTVNHARDTDVTEEMTIQAMLDMYDVQKKMKLAA